MKRKLLLAAAVPLLSSLLWAGPNANACGSGSERTTEAGDDEILTTPDGTVIYLSDGDGPESQNGYVGAQNPDGSYVELDGQDGYVIDAGDGTSSRGLSVSNTGEVCTAIP